MPIDRRYRLRDLLIWCVCGAIGAASAMLVGCVVSGDEWLERGSLLVVLLSLLLAAALAIFTLREKPISALNTLRVTILLAVLFLIPLVVFAPIGLEVDTSPAWGFFGVVAGYLLRPIEEAGASASTGG